MLAYMANDWILRARISPKPPIFDFWHPQMRTFLTRKVSPKPPEGNVWGTFCQRFTQYPLVMKCSNGWSSIDERFNGIIKPASEEYVPCILQRKKWFPTYTYNHLHVDPPGYCPVLSPGCKPQTHGSSQGHHDHQKTWNHHGDIRFVWKSCSQ